MGTRSFWKKVLLLFVILMAMMFVGALLQSFASIPSLILLLALALFLMFPGKNPERPRLFKVLPWFWGLNFLAAVFVGVALIMNIPGLPKEIKEATTMEILVALVFMLPTIWSFQLRHRYFRWIFILGSILGLAEELRKTMSEPAGTEQLVEIACAFVSTGLLLFYVLRKFKPRMEKEET